MDGVRLVDRSFRSNDEDCMPKPGSLDGRFGKGWPPIRVLYGCPQNGMRRVESASNEGWPLGIDCLSIGRGTLVGNGGNSIWSIIIISSIICCLYRPRESYEVPTSLYSST